MFWHRIQVWKSPVNCTQLYHVIPSYTMLYHGYTNVIPSSEIADFWDVHVHHFTWRNCRFSHSFYLRHLFQVLPTSTRNCCTQGMQAVESYHWSHMIKHDLTKHYDSDCKLWLTFVNMNSTSSQWFLILCSSRLSLSPFFYLLCRLFRMLLFGEPSSDAPWSQVLNFADQLAPNSTARNNPGLSGRWVPASWLPRAHQWGHLCCLWCSAASDSATWTEHLRVALKQLPKLLFHSTISSLFFGKWHKTTVLLMFIYING